MDGEEARAIRRQRHRAGDAAASLAADDVQGAGCWRGRCGSGGAAQQQAQQGEDENAQGQNRRSNTVITSPGCTKACRTARASDAWPFVVRITEA